MRRRGTRLLMMGALACSGLLAGCRQDMHDQPKFYPQRGTDLFADGRSARPQVANTVARNQLNEGSYFTTGFVNGREGDGMPFPATLAVLERGQEKYNVFCTPCHSRVGNGGGMIVQRGYAQAGNFHEARLRSAPLGHFFNVISNGYGAMPDYASQLTVSERWAVVAYIRALQLSQNATQADVAANEHAEPLESIAEREGLPANFAYEWSLPPTATRGTPGNQDYVIPLGTDVNPAQRGGNTGSAVAPEQSNRLSGGGQGTSGPGTGRPAGAGHAMTSPAGGEGSPPVHP